MLEKALERAPARVRVKASTEVLVVVDCQLRPTQHRCSSRPCYFPLSLSPSSAHCQFALLCLRFVLHSGGGPGFQSAHAQLTHSLVVIQLWPRRSLLVLPCALIVNAVMAEDSVRLNLVYLTRSPALTRPLAHLSFCIVLLRLVFAGPGGGFRGGGFQSVQLGSPAYLPGAIP